MKNRIKFPENLTLTHIKGYAMSSSDDERSSSIKGYFRDFSAASAASKSAGWFGGDGNVNEVENLYTDGNRLFVVEFASDPEYEKKEKQIIADRIKIIKKKLDPDEIELLGLNKE